MKRIIGEKLAVPLSPAVQCGPFLFLSGQVPTRPDGSIPEGIEAQTELVLDKLKALAESAGFSLSDFVKTTVFLKNLAYFERMNGAYRKYFPSDPPARSTIGVATLPLGAPVEIDAVVVLPG